MKKTTGILNTSLLLIAAYLIYHIISGNRGVIAYINLKDIIAQKQSQLIAVTEKRKIIEKKVHLLNAKKIDVDFLDELTRKELGLAVKDEKCFIIDYNKTN